MARLAHHPNPLNPMVHLLHHLPQTRIHRHVPNVVDHVPKQHDQMAQTRQTLTQK